MRVAAKTQNDIVVFETNNITFSSTGYIYVKVDSAPGGSIRFPLAPNDDVDELRVKALSNGYLNLVGRDIEYYDDWDHRYYKEGEKEKLYREQAERQKQDAVLSEVNAEGANNQ